MRAEGNDVQTHLRDNYTVTLAAHARRGLIMSGLGAYHPRPCMHKMFLLASVILCVCVLVVPGTSVSCKIDSSNPCKCSFTDGEGATWNIDISSYFQYP